MPEGKGEMPSLPETSRPTPLSRETKLTLSFAKLPFSEVIAQERRLENLLQSQEIQTNEERKNKVASSLEAVTRRRDKLVADFRNSGKLDPVDRKFEALRQMGDRFAPEVLREELNLADTMDERNGIPRADKHYGVLGWYYRGELKKLKIGQQPVDTQSKSEFTEAVDSVTKAVGDFSRSIGELKTTMEQSGQLRPSLTPEQIAQMTAAQMMAYSQQQTEQMRSVFGRMDPLAEESRWIDVEYSQEFYTRFTPNMEPHFYTEIKSGSERRIWEARWRLARAAFFKKIYSGLAEKLVENQDLIEFSTEDMETLYEKVPGVKFALEWYVDAIIRGKEVELFDFDDKTGKRILVLDSKGNPTRRGIWGVKFGTDFEEIRKTMRHSLMTEWSITEEQRAGMEEKEKAMLDNGLKSADAIAWNWIFCGNLLESIDSRYSSSGKRHGNLASEICSDDLRAVFHPQEKFEDKCWKGQEWGVFGRWGLIQTDRIKREKKFNKDHDKILFESASRRTDYWRAERTGKKVVDDDGKEKEVIKVYAPECYPIITLKSFWERYEFTTEGSQQKKSKKMTYLEGLLEKEKILWRKSEIPDAWKIDYVTIRMRKAIGLFDHFTKGEGKPGWVSRLKDFYTRLNIDDVLNDYYGNGKQERDKAKKHFQNIKVWAVYAVRGGIGRPQDRDVTDPYSTSIIKGIHQWNRLDDEVPLRKPQQGNYLEQGEKLEIQSIE